MTLHQLSQEYRSKRSRGQSRLLQLPEGVKEESDTRDYDSLDSIIAAIRAFPSYDAAKEARIIYHDTSTDRYYIGARRDSHDVRIVENAGDVYPKWTFEIVKVLNEPVPLEVDMFRQLHRDDSLPTIKVEITPAPMYFWGSPFGCELIDMRNSESTEQSEEESETKVNFEEFIDGYNNRETTAAHLYAAFFSGVYDLGGVAYTDSEHARKLFTLYNYQTIDYPPNPATIKNLCLSLHRGNTTRGAYGVITISHSSFLIPHLNKRYGSQSLSFKEQCGGFGQLWALLRLCRQREAH